MPQNKNTPRRQNVNLNSRWLQNTLRSLGISATNTFSDLMPASAGTISTGTRLATDAARTIRSNRTGSKLIQDAIKNNQLVKIGQDFFKNAINDIRSGQWNDHTDRGTMGDMIDDMDTMFGDMDTMFNDSSEGSDSTDIVMNNFSTGNDASIKAIERASEYSVRSAKATVDTMVALGSTSMIRMEELGNKAINELTGINSTLNALLEYQNTNMTRFIEASIGYYDQMTTPKEESSNSSTIKAENLYSDKGLDFATYKDYILQNIKKIRDEDGNISMMSMLVENLPDMLANPMELVTKSLIKKVIPSVTKDAMASMDKSIQNFIPYLLERIGYLGEGQTGVQGTALQYIGKVFGTRTTAKKELDFSDIKTGPVPYNGKANHTITEIIPKYLREGTNYLRIIAEHFTGQTVDAMNRSAMGFNWSTGRFQSMEDMQRSLQNDYLVQVLGNFNTSDFGKKFLSTAHSVLQNDQERNGMENILQQIMINAMQGGKRFNFSDDNQIQEIVDGLSATENQKKFVFEFLAQMKEQNDAVLGNLENQRINTIRRSNSYIKQINENSGMDNSVYQLYSGRSEENILQDINDYLRGSSGVNSFNSENGTTAPNNAVILQSNESLRNAIRENQISDTTISDNNYGGFSARPFRAFAHVMNSIMAGNSDSAWDAFISGIGDSFRQAGSFLSHHFLNPIKNALFGERNQNGYINGGIFAGINNRMKESFFSLRRLITGKGYIDSEGNIIQDASGEELNNTVVGKLRSSVNWLKDAISIRLFGERNEDGTYSVDDDGNTKDGILGKTKRSLVDATSSLLNGLVGWKKALFGNSKDGEAEDGKAIFQKIKDKANDIAPNAIAGGIGGGLLGFLVGGPVGGAMLGFAGGIVSKSDRFKKWLFGDEDSEGIISKNVQAYVKKNGKFLAGGAVIGGIQGATGVGILGSIVGGPLTGALLGVGTSMLIKSDMFQKFLFGDPEKGQLGLKQHVGRWMKKIGINSDTDDVSGRKITGMAGIGAIGGGLIGLMIGGPIIGALGGLGLSILAQKDNFHEWLFGSVDEKTGSRKEGVLGQFKNMLIANVFTPVGDSIKNIGDDFKTFFKYRILGQFNLIVERVGDSLFSAIGKITGTAMASIGDFGSYIKENFLKKFIEGAGNILSPLTTATTKIAEGIYAVGKAIIAAPLNILGVVLNPVAGALAGVVGTVGTAMVKTINTVLIKPVNALIIKPLGGAIKLAGRVIAAPFKMIASTFDWINNTLVSKISHITRFASAVADHVKQEFTQKIIDPIKNSAKSAFVKIKDFVLKPINIVADFAKDVLTSVGVYAKQRISKFFSQALHMLNPITWIKGITRIGGNVLNIISGGRIGNGSREKRENSGSGRGWLGKLWRDTKTGTGKDRSASMIYDDNGNLIDTKLSRSQRGKALFEEEAAEIASNKERKVERKNIQKNQKMIRKYTKGQRFEDTEENRQLAEAAAGHKLDWGKVGPKKSEFEKLSENYYDETIDLQTQIKNYMKDVAKFLLGSNFRAYGSSTPEDAKNAARRMGASMQRARDARRDIINEASLDQSYHAKQDAQDAKVVDRRITRREDRQHRNQIVEDVENNGLRSGIRNAFSFMIGRFRGDIPANATGTTGAKAGPSIVGERGPEVVYRKNDRFGKLVGLNGPEVIQMKGGETIIPNHRLPKYENDITESPLFKLFDRDNKSDDDIERVTDTTKLSMNERILRKLSEIKSSIIEAFVGGNRKSYASIRDMLYNKDTEIDDISKTADISQNSIFGGDGSDTNMVDDGEENSTLDQAAAQSLVNGKTGAFMRMTLSEEKKRAEDTARENAELAALQDLRSETKEHNSVWDSIFSKKGLITGGIIAALPLITAFLKSDFFDKIINLLGNFGNILGDFLGDAKDQFDWTNEEDARENGETIDQRATANIDRFTQLGVFDENGNADNISYPASKLIARGAFNNRNIISGIGHTLGAVGSTTANVLKSAQSKIGRTVVDTKALADLALDYGDDAYDLLSENKVMTTSAKAINTVRTSTPAKAISNTVSVVTEPLKKISADGSKLFSQVSDIIIGFFDDILKKFSSKTGLKASTSILSKIKPTTIVNALKSRWASLSAKISALLGGRVSATAVSAGLAEAVFVSIAAINGISGTAKLFHVRSDDVDGKMRIISTLFGGLLGTTPGAVIDLVCSVFYDITGIDVLSSLATSLYNFWAGEEDSLKLEYAQKEFEEEYVAYQDSEILKQYETQKAAGLISSDTSYDQFYDMAHTGEVGIDYDSFANYNANVNASIGDNIMKGFSAVGSGIKNGWNWLTGKDEVVYTDESGNIYKKNKDGTYQVTSADGNDLGYVAEDALAQRNMFEIVKENDNIFQKVGNSLNSFGSSLFQKTKDTWGRITTIADDVKTSVTNFFVSHPEKVWFDIDGSYWRSEEGMMTHYNANGSKIGEPISNTDFEALLSSGSLAEGEIQVDSGLKQGITSFSKNITDSWKNFTSSAMNFATCIREKAGASLVEAKEVIGDVTASIKNFLLSHTEKRYFDTEGGYYQTNGNTFDYYNQNGDLISKGITTDDFAELVKSGAVTEGNSQDVTINSSIRMWFDDIAKMGKESFTKWKDSAIEMWTPVKEKAGAALKAIKDAGGPISFIGGLFINKKESAWFDTNGNYYKLESDGSYSKYNMNGDVLEEDIDAEKIQELAEAGLLTQGDIEVDTEAQKAIRQIKDVVKDAWSAAKNTVVSGWESFKNWITGGSGTSSYVFNEYTKNSKVDISGGSGFGVTKDSFIRGGRGESQPSTMNGIPYYSQNDNRWADNSYEPLDVSDGATMSNTGCGPTAMSMVIGGMTKNKPLPTELARYAQVTGTRDDTGTNWNFIDSAASTYGLQPTRSIMPSRDFIVDNLSVGNPMILSGQSDNNGPYTKAGHYIVATGIDGSGNVSYNDPRGAGYSGKMNINNFINNTGAAWSFNTQNSNGAFGVNKNVYTISKKNKFIRGGRGTGVVASDIVLIAKNEVGYIAKNTNSDLDSKYSNPLPSGKYNGYTKYARDTFPDKNGLPWCAMFVCWVFKTAANGDTNKAKELMCSGGYSAGCSDIKKAFSSKNQILSNTSSPIPGDIVLFNFRDGTSSWPNPQHVGIVIGTDGNNIITVEGNTSAKSQDKGGCVEMKERSRDTIVCFCRPIYDDTSAFQGISEENSSMLNDSSKNTSYSSIVSEYSSLFGTFANAAYDAVLTGNTNIDWSNVFSGTDEASTSSTISSSSFGVTSSNSNDNIRKSIEFFRSKGLTDAQISGILGCWKAESGVTPAKVEGYYLNGYPSNMNYVIDRSRVDNFTEDVLFPAYDNSGMKINKSAYMGTDGHYYPGVGLAQWTGSRGQTYVNLFNKNGYKFGDIEPELEMVWNELSPGGVRSGALPALKATTTPDAATDVFCKKYEGYSGSDGIKTRQGYAREFYNNMDQLVSGGSGDGISIANHRYLIEENKTDPEYNKVSDISEPIKTPIHINQLNKGGYGFSGILSRMNNASYDDTLIVNLLNQVIKYLGSISTNTKQLDLLKDIKTVGGNTFNVTEIKGGTTTNTVNSHATGRVKNNISTEMSKSEMTARRIAGISI